MNLAALETSSNVFATIVRAHLQAQRTRHDPMARLDGKLRLLRRLYQRGYSREEIVGLFRFIDWLLALPPDLERRFRSELEAFEQEQKMPYITSVERIGREEGRQEGRQEGLQEGVRAGLLDAIEVALRLRFGAASQELLPEIRQVTDFAVIRSVMTQIESTSTPEDLRRLYR